MGKHLIYTYDNGWQYEMYIRNTTTIDYRIHAGMVGGRWVKGQQVDLVRLGADAYKISWTEPTGSSVSVTVQPLQRRLHAVIFFPQTSAMVGATTAAFRPGQLVITTDGLRAVHFRRTSEINWDQVTRVTVGRIGRTTAPSARTKLTVLVRPGVRTRAHSPFSAIPGSGGYELAELDVTEVELADTLAIFVPRRIRVHTTVQN